MIERFIQSKSEAKEIAEFHVKNLEERKNYTSSDGTKIK